MLKWNSGTEQRIPRSTEIIPMTTKKKITSPPSTIAIEEGLQRLEEIADTLQEGKLPLEESLALYEEGLALTRACAERLQQASLTVKRLEKDLAGTLKLIDDTAEFSHE